MLLGVLPVLSVLIITVLMEKQPINLPFLRLCHIICGMDERLKVIIQLVALLFLGSVLSFSPRDTRLARVYERFQAAYQAQDYRAMADHVAVIAQHQPWREELWEKAGHFAHRAGDAELAIQHFEKAQEVGSLSTQGQVDLGTLYDQQGASQLAEQVWSGVEGSPEAAKYLAEFYQERGDYPAAIQEWERYISLRGEVDPRTHYTLGLLLAAYDPVESLAHLQGAAAEIPGARKLLDTLDGASEGEPAYKLVVAGQGLASLGRWKLGEAAFARALEFRPDYAQAWAYWGEALQQVGQKDEDPLAALEKAYELDPDSGLVNIFLGTYWQRQGDHRKALSYYRAAGEIWPENPDVYVEKGRSWAVLGDLEKALTMYKKAIELRPETPDYYRLLAQFCINYHYRVREEGLPAARQAVQISEGSPASLVAMGQVMFELDDLQNAKKFYVQALEKDVTFVQAHLSLGLTYFALDDGTRASQHLESVLQLTDDPVMVEQARRMLAALSPSEK